TGHRRPRRGESDGGDARRLDDARSLGRARPGRAPRERRASGDRRRARSDARPGRPGDDAHLHGPGPGGDSRRLMTTGYQAQARGQLTAYERYLAGMDASMRQKVALTAAHLLCEGRIADMGMGSGQGSHALAALYPRLEVIGVDIDDTMVALARQQYR